MPRPEISTRIAEFAKKFIPSRSPHKLATMIAATGPQLQALESARDQEVVNGPELLTQAQRELYRLSRIELALGDTDSQGFAQWPTCTLRSPLSHQDRMRIFPSNHPAHGFLPLIFLARNPHESGYDGQNLTTLYRLDRNRTDVLPGELITELNRIFRSVMEEQIPSLSQVDIDRRRFFGMEGLKDEDVLTLVENDLLARVGEKAREFSVKNSQEKIGYLKLFLSFSRASDRLREWKRQNTSDGGKRKTHERYYFHHLAATHMLWSAFESQIESAGDFDELLEDSEVLLIHDNPEDFPEEFECIEKRHRFSYSYRLHLKGEEADTIPQPTDEAKKEVLLLEDGLGLSQDQKILLDAITKNPLEGANWFRKLRNIRLPKIPGWESKIRQMVRRANRIKAPDQLANLATMTATGGTFVKVLANLNEKIESGGQLQLGSLFTDDNPQTIKDRLKRLMRENRLEPYVAAIPLIAHTEKLQILSAFGKRLTEMILESREPILREFAQALQTAAMGFNQLFYPLYTTWSESVSNDRQKALLTFALRHQHLPEQGLPHAVPFGFKRLEQLSYVYKLQPWYIDNCIPAEHLSEHIGLANFYRHYAKDYPQTPLDFNTLVHYVHNLAIFYEAMTPLEGSLPGAVDTVWVPVSLERQQNRDIHAFLQHMKDHPTRPFAWKPTIAGHSPGGIRRILYRR